LPAKMTDAKQATPRAVEVIEIESRFIKLQTASEDASPEVGESVQIEFRLGGNQFQFAATVSRATVDGLVWLDKPETIAKTRIRNASRTDTHTPVHFTVWTEVGRYQGELLDISEDGLRMLAYHRLQRLDLINVDLFLAAADPGLRINAQATVVWCNSVEDGKNLFETGVQFQTLPEAIRARLSDYARASRIGAGSTP
ncbi:MAG: PilZ domain-containing protein, partial [Leptospirales bacterium]